MINKQELITKLKSDYTSWQSIENLKAAGAKLQQLILSQNLEYSASLESIDTIVALSFGYGNKNIESNKKYDPKTHSPGTSNSLMAELIKELDLNIPLFSQLEISEALAALGIESKFVADPRSCLLYKSPSPRDPL